MNVIILDRDGVINKDSDQFIKNPDEWLPIPGSLEAIAQLNHSGFHVFVASNQSGVGRKLFDISVLNQIHQKMYDELQDHGARIDGIVFCPHTPSDNCNCRKPKPGMLTEIANRTNQKPEDILAIGDSFRDIQAAASINMKPILVLTGNGRRTYEENKDELDGIPVFDDLSQAVESIIKSK